MTSAARRRRWLAAVCLVTALLLCYGAGCNSGSRRSGRLYFPEGDNLVSLDLKNGKKQTVLRSRRLEHALVTQRTHYDVSRDNRYIAYVETTYGRDIDDTRPQLQTLVVLDRRRHTTALREVIADYVVFPVALSPDGKMVAIICESDSKDRPVTLRVLRVADGKQILSSIPAYNNSATWSPDGSRVGISDLWSRPVIIRLSDRKKEVLPSSGIPMWSPDGKFIAIDETHMWLTAQRKMVSLKLPKDAILTGWTPDSKSLLYTYEDMLKRYPLCTYDINSGQTSKVISDQGDVAVWR